MARLGDYQHDILVFLYKYGDQTLEALHGNLYPCMSREEMQDVPLSVTTGPLKRLEKRRFVRFEKLTLAGKLKGSSVVKLLPLGRDEIGWRMNRGWVC